jgi:nucleotide-binding universal stress UspA family protein
MAMTVLCGTDFSGLATEAARVAGLMARASGQDLYLVHVLPAELPPPDSKSRLGQAGLAVDRLAWEAETLQVPGLPIVTDVMRGAADEALVKRARELGATLIVVGAMRHRVVDRWVLGSCADATAREAPLPVLVVRAAEPFSEWLVNGRALKVLVGCEAGPSSDGALGWAGALRKIGPIDLVVARLVVPGEENQRVGVSGPGMGVALLPETKAKLLEELCARKRSLLGDGDIAVRLQVIPALGRLDRQLVTAAEELGVDLVVVGSHHREGFRRWWHGSVSGGVLHSAPMSVAVVPILESGPADS